MTHRQLPRRTFLRGLGTAVALPLLDAMLPSSALAAPARKKVYPTRMAFVYVPNGAHMQDWTPAAQGAGFELPAILKPLDGVRDQLLVLTGLTADKARPNGDGPGDHARALAAILTGCQPKKTNGADINVGISVDQYAALHVGKHTRFASLELGIDRGAQAGNCDSGYSCAYSSNISWRSENTPMAKEIDPRLVFERLFNNGVRREMDENQARRERYRKSILDFVLEDASALKGSLGATDQMKLDEYLTGIREIEKRLAFSQTHSADAVAGVRKPDGTPSDYAEHIRLMADMLVLAFQADLTRISTFMLANEGSNRSYAFMGVPEGHHDLSHHGGDPEKHAKIRQINTFHMTQFAYMAEKMRSIKEGDGTLLDHAMIAYCSGIGDGNRHNHDDLPVLLLGKGSGTLKTGRHLAYPSNTPVNNLWLSMLQRMNVPCEKLGDSTGRLDQLSGLTTG